jgi:hypothetical protein
LGFQKQSFCPQILRDGEVLKQRIRKSDTIAPLSIFDIGIRRAISRSGRDSIGSPRRWQIASQQMAHEEILI